MILVLLRHRLRLLRNQVLYGSRSWLGVVGVVVGVAALAGTYWGSAVVFGALAREDPLLPRLLLPAAFATTAVFVVIASIWAILQELYLASDLDLLLAAPISLGSLFVLKVIECIMSIAFVWLFGLAAVLGYGAGLDAGPAFVPLALFAMGATMLVGVAASLIFIMLITRVVPAGRVQAILSFVAALAAVLIWLISQTASFNQAAGTGGYSAAGLRQLESGIIQWNSSLAWTPPGWAADAVTAFQVGDVGAVAINLLLLLCAGAAALSLAYVTFHQTFYVGWGRLRETRVSGRVSRPLRVARRWTFLPLPAPVRAITLKEWRTLRRDLRLLSLLFTPLALTALFTLRGFWGPAAGPSGSDVFSMSIFVAASLAFFVGTYFSVLAFGHEGRNFALLRSSPITRDQLLAGKFVAHFLPLTVAVWAVVLGIGIMTGGSAFSVAASLVASCWLTGGAVMSGLAAGSLATNLGVDNPQKSVGLGGRMLAMLLGGLYLGTNAGLLFWLSYLASSLIRGQYHLVASLVITLVAGGAALGSAALVVTVARRGMRSLEVREVQ